jgi:hypothetical protein
VKLTVVLAGASLLAACGVMPVPSGAPIAPGAPQITFAMPESWARLEGSGPDAHYFTSGDPDVCANVVGACDPTTYVMAPGTIDVAITPVTDESGCAEVGSPTWDARVEARAAAIREATYRLTWTVCYPDTGEAVQVAADLRAGDAEVRDELLGQLRGFVESVVLVRGRDQFAPEK